ncbi:hypothetical protein AciM339_0712 [Aciduliprofundum sp. MAR08-339]|uniref:hypothetical protein n=1 Tax=Aciduliprofundum sp. (strain MAR08-339) TaxID=673860 RepID=UPI0002A4854C|nr:hypothetical protein AciM339_0712 [Aciduliprofundum sp. MAR08-339]
MVVHNIELNDEIKELLNGLLDDELERKIVFLVMSGKKHEEILEEILQYLREKGGDSE